MTDRLWKGAARAVALLALAATAAAAGEPAPFAARAGVEIATAAARAWSADAALVYVENDEDLDSGGGSPRWGYLFYSASRDEARSWSIRDGRIAVAQNLAMRFDAPPVAPTWLDSDAALAAAEGGDGGAYRREHGGTVATMLLMRGAFDAGDPDDTTWTLVYVAAGQPSLFVVVDARDGRVRRTWRG
jgi:hypothetical protein